MSFDPYEFDRDYGQSSRMESIGQYTAKTFLWMVLGLLVTFGIALLGWVTNATLYALAYVPYIHLIVLIATIVLSITMVSRIEKMSVGTARGIFIAFSALFGFTMSMYLYIFEFGSLIFVFLATAAYFAVLAAYGYFTKADLTRLRPILFTGLVFLFVFALVSLFIPGFTALDRIFCLAGIAIFLGYTAYDTQKIKAYYNYYAGYPDMLEKASIFSALQLYLDFINLFLYLLRTCLTDRSSFPFCSSIAEKEGGLLAPGSGGGLIGIAEGDQGHQLLILRDLEIRLQAFPVKDAHDHGAQPQVVGGQA